MDGAGAGSLLSSGAGGVSWLIEAVKKSLRDFPIMATGVRIVDPW